MELCCIELNTFCCRDKIILSYWNMFFLASRAIIYNGHKWKENNIDGNVMCILKEHTCS